MILFDKICLECVVELLCVCYFGECGIFVLDNSLDVFVVCYCLIEMVVWMLDV